MLVMLVGRGCNKRTGPSRSGRARRDETTTVCYSRLCPDARVHRPSVHRHRHAASAHPGDLRRQVRHQGVLGWNVYAYRQLLLVPHPSPPLTVPTPCADRGEGEAARDGLPSDRFSWYCSWQELRPFWEELAPPCVAAPRVLVPGVGVDGAIAELFDAGWHDLSAFDYSADAVERARSLFGNRAIALCCADATALPYADGSFDAVLDKGTLDAIGIGSDESLRAAVAELARTVATGGVVVSISRALEASELLAAFEQPGGPPVSGPPLAGRSGRATSDAGRQWQVLRNGELHIAETGEASVDLAAGLFAWRRLPPPPPPT